MSEHWLTESVPENDFFMASSERGWANDQLGMEWLNKVFEPVTASKGLRRRLLIVDGHASHVKFRAPAAMRAPSDWGTHLPPHITHRLQPVDVGVISRLALPIPPSSPKCQSAGSVAFPRPKLSSTAYSETRGADRSTLSTSRRHLRRRAYIPSLKDQGSGGDNGVSGLLGQDRYANDHELRWQLSYSIYLTTIPRIADHSTGHSPIHSIQHIPKEMSLRGPSEEGRRKSLLADS